MGEENERIDPFTKEDPGRPASSTQAFHRWPFSASLFKIPHLDVWGTRAIKHPGSNRDHTLAGSWGVEKTGRKVEDKSNGSPPATLPGGSTCSPQQWAPVRVAPLSDALWATRICPVIHYGVQWAPRGRRQSERWVRVVAERQADTSRDKMVGLEKKQKNNTPHPSPTQKQEGRQMRRRRIKKR